MDSNSEHLIQDENIEMITHNHAQNNPTGSPINHSTINHNRALKKHPMLTEAIIY
jgi:hypothetical protein